MYAGRLSANRKGMTMVATLSSLERSVERFNGTVSSITAEATLYGVVRNLSGDAFELNNSGDIMTCTFTNELRSHIEEAAEEACEIEAKGELTIHVDGTQSFKVLGFEVLPDSHVPYQPDWLNNSSSQEGKTVGDLLAAEWLQGWESNPPETAQEVAEIVDYARTLRGKNSG